MYVCQRGAGMFSVMFCNFSENTNGSNVIAFFFNKKNKFTCSAQREDREKDRNFQTQFLYH